MDRAILARQLAERAAPMWWRGDSEACALRPDARFWAQETASPLAGTALADQPGIIFPAAQENGRAGALAF